MWAVSSSLMEEEEPSSDVLLPKSFFKMAFRLLSVSLRTEARELPEERREEDFTFGL